MRVFLVDDEPPALGMLAFLLKDIPDIEVVGSADDAITAYEMINELCPDLVFLDIEMPVLSGFEMLPYLTCKPMIIFCTAYEEYALKAFEINAIDYLMKPVNSERLAQSLTRATEWDRLQNLKSQMGLPRGLSKVVTTVGSQRVVTRTTDIRYVRREDRYLQITTAAGKDLLASLSMSYLAENLDEHMFFQVNRSLIVHRDVVASYKYLDSGNMEVKTNDGDSFTVARRRARNFKEWFEGVT